VQESHSIDLSIECGVEWSGTRRNGASIRGPRTCTNDIFMYCGPCSLLSLSPKITQPAGVSCLSHDQCLRGLGQDCLVPLRRDLVYEDTTSLSGGGLILESPSLRVPLSPPRFPIITNRYDVSSADGLMRDVVVVETAETTMLPQQSSPVISSSPLRPPGLFPQHRRRRRRQQQQHRYQRTRSLSNECDNDGDDDNRDFDDNTFAGNWSLEDEESYYNNNNKTHRNHHHHGNTIVDLDVCQQLDLEYDQALEDRQIVWTARYQSVRQSTVVSIFCMVFLIVSGTAFYYKQAEPYWTVPEALLFTIYTITTVGYVD
jgi:Ion channel